MLKLKVIHAIALFSLIIGNASIANEISAYLHMDTQSTPITKLSPHSPAIKNAKPVRQQPYKGGGWQLTQIKSEFTGFVPQKKVTKQLTVRPGSLIFQKRSLNSPAITLVDSNEANEVYVLRIKNGWAEVEFTKTITVYFNLNKNIPKPPSKAKETRKHAVSQTYLPKEKQSAASELPRNFEGILTLKKHFPILNKGYSFELVNSNGKPIAFVDTTNLMITNSIQNYLNKPVIVYGAPKSISHKSSQIVIQATNIRIN